ncbi:MMPL family transporter [Actinoplanes sp. NPDC048791]|uniref:MMPL family transporter n=1 Tax=Actinoplanes sp. NPDC048791 TaxID=3154623 RepID=UPI0033D2FC33
MSRFADGVLRFKVPVLLFWLAALVAGIFAAGQATDRLSRDFSFPGARGYEANVSILREYGNGGSGSPLVTVVTLPGDTTVDDPAVRDGLREAYAKLDASGQLRSVAYPVTDDRRLISPDGRTLLGLVFKPFYGERSAGPDLVPTVTGALTAGLPAGTTVQVTGIDALSAQAADSEVSTGVLVETMIGAIGALVVLLFVFRSFLALLPLLLAAVSILTTFLLVWGLTGITQVNFLVQYLIALIGLGVAIDYALLIVNRWREERGNGLDSREATVRAMSTAGSAVLFSATAVGFGLLVLVFLPVPFLRSVGYGGLLIPVVSALVNLTLLPVLLATVGERLDWPRRAARHTRSRLWAGWAALVYRRRWLATFIALALLVPLCVAAFGTRIGSPPADALTPSGPAYQGLVQLRSADLPDGSLTPIEIRTGSPAEAQRVADRVAALPGIRTATAPAGPAWTRPGSALVTVIPDAETSTATGKRTVERVRGVVDAEFPAAQVGGTGAQEIDATSSLYRYFPLMLAVIALITFLVLIRAFRSVLLALQAILLNLLSLAAAYGALVLIWQEGYGSQLWDSPATGSITMWVPLMTFAFLFGLSMDYEVFLLTRIREEYDRTGDGRTAVVEGLSRIGRLVTSAALILFLAFASMAILPDVNIKIMASGLGIGILLDATLLRALLVPALISISGRHTWWVPRWLERALLIRPRPVPPATPAPAGTVPRGDHLAEELTTR